MKTAISKLIVSLIALTLMVSVAVGLSGKTERVQAAAVSQQQPGPELLGSSYGNLLNNLIAAGGR